MKLSTTGNFRILNIATHTFALGGFVYLYTTHAWAWLLLTAFMFVWAGLIGVNVGLHRYFAHKSFKTGKIREHFLLFSAFLSGLGSPGHWGTVHLHHHMHADTPEDPHSPDNSSPLFSWFGFWPHVNISPRLFKRQLSTPAIRWVHDHYFKLIWLYAMILWFIDPRLMIFGWAIPVMLCFHGAASIGVLTHLSLPGNYINYHLRDKSKNSWIAWFLSLGEGWHNNHHANPGNYRQGRKWWELDPSAFLIKHLFRTSTDDN